MLRLPSHILEQILLPLPISDLISLSAVNRPFHHTIREIPSIQYKLYLALYHSSDDQVEHTSNPTKGIMDLVESQRNILRLTPRISSLGIGKNERVYKVYQDMIVTIPTLTPISSACLARDGTEEYILCTMYGNNRTHKVYATYPPIYHTLTILSSKDIMVYIDQEGYIHLHKYHSYGTEKYEHVNAGIEIPSEEWNRTENPDQVKLDLMEDDKMVIDLGTGIWLIYNWKTGDLLHRFPPNNRIWSSCHGSLITKEGLMIGLDIPRLAWMHHNPSSNASLAIFSLSSPLTAPYLPQLLLELPTPYRLLKQTIKTLWDIPSKVKVIISPSTPPRIHTATNPSFVRISMPFKLVPRSSYELNLVIPIKQLPLIKIENRIKPWIKGRTWRYPTDPFDGVESIKWDNWKSRCHMYIERVQTSFPTQKSINSSSLSNEECQIGQRLYRVDNSLLTKKGQLSLEITDFDFHEIGQNDDGYGALKGIKLDMAPQDGQRPNKPRTSPRYYKISEQAGTANLPRTLNCSGSFFLGYPGEIEGVLGDENGTRLVIQQKGNDKIWIIDFGS
ncbi:hypothetical protein V865_001381 [Kwoniella europaea PYCC6329]|uniref:F-box domain-containing protein n=1 Tax=Kwoniella europaea PYCC6329 TaxID=1423913 RepID=A0AAX4KBL4_9TREE